MSTKLPANDKSKSPKGSSFTPAPAGLVQRKCACGNSLGVGDECNDCRQNRLAAQPPGLQTKPAVSQPGDRYEQEADRAAEQVLGGEAATLSSSGPAIQRQAAGENEDEAATSEPAAETEPAVESAELETESGSEPEATSETPAGAAPAGGLIVEDDAAVGPGQMTKGAFLDELRSSACAVADAELAAVGRSTEGCPYVERMIAHYRTKDSGHVERAIRKYAPETASTTSARDYIPLVSERIRQGVARWAQTGDLSGVPEELLGQAMGGGLLGSIAGALGGMFFKARDGGAKEANPQAIQSQLRSGSPLDGGVRGRMETAFGYDFSKVRVHTDGQAANLSTGLNARAFTVGSDVAFGAGEYQPGTMVGDALLAHELAHVVQQGGAATADAPQPKGAVTNALEEDADTSAVGAVMSMWGGAKGGLAKVAQSAMPRLKSGLRLSRCKSDSTPEKTPPGPATPMKTVALNIVHLEKSPASHASDLAQAQDTYKPANVKFDVTEPPAFDDAKTKSLIGDDYILDEYTSVGTPTAEETKLLAEPAGRKTGAISMYYVKGLSHNSTGESFWPKDWPSTPASVVITSKDTKETFSHELGHVLLNDGGHHADRDNLMFTTNFKFNLDETQRKTIYNSSFAK